MVTQGVPIVAELLAILCQPCLDVFDDADQIEPYQQMGGRSARLFSQMMHLLLHTIGAFAAAAQIHDRLEARRVSRNGWVVPGVLIGAHVNHRSHFGVGIAQDMAGALVEVHVPAGLTAVVSGPLHRTIEIDAVIGGRAVSAHFKSARAKGNAPLIARFGRARGIDGVLGAGVEGYDGFDVLGE